MSQRTERLYSFVIGKPLNLSNDYFFPLNEESNILLDDYVESNDSNAYKFTEHQIIFNVNMSSTNRDANKGEFTLHNLDDSVVSYLNGNKSNNLVVIFKAGDNVQGLKEILKGTVTKVEDDWKGDTRKTKITVTDGGVNIKEANSVRSYPRGTPYKTIIKDLNSDMKFPICRMAEIEGSTSSPVSFYGKSYHSILDELYKLDYNYAIINGEASIIPKRKRLTYEASYISEDTGLIGRVSSHVDDTNSTTGGEGSKSDGVKFSCLIDGSIKPDETVYVSDRDFEGAYKVTQVSYTGDFYSTSPFTCSVTATRIEATIDV